MWENLQRIVEKRGWTGKKGVGDTLEGGDTRVKAIKSDKVMSKKGLATKKRSPGFSGTNRGVTPSSVAAPGATHPSDATARVYVVSIMSV